MSTHHLLRGEFGKKLLHKLILRAATLEACLTSASMPSKGAITSLHQHFDNQFVNEGIRKYTSVLLQGKEPTFGLLLLMPPPPLFEVWDPDPTGHPRRWNKPWKLTQSPSGTDNPGKGSQAGLPAEDPILRMASSRV